MPTRLVTTVILARHGSIDLIGKALAGRAPGVHLNERGVSEAERLADNLANAPIAAIYVSPRERASETAAPLAARLRVPAQTCDEIDEIDFGRWTGLSFVKLNGEAEWRTWVERRSNAQPPGGESMVAVQKRVVDTIEQMRCNHLDQTIALVTHGDVIKAALAHYMGLTLDNLERFDIAPASVSVVAAGAGWAQVKLVNWTGAL